MILAFSIFEHYNNKQILRHRYFAALARSRFHLSPVRAALVKKGVRARSLRHFPFITRAVLAEITSGELIVQFVRLVIAAILALKNRYSWRSEISKFLYIFLLLKIIWSNITGLWLIKSVSWFVRWFFSWFVSQIFKCSWKASRHCIENLG